MSPRALVVALALAGSCARRDVASPAPPPPVVVAPPAPPAPPADAAAPAPAAAPAEAPTEKPHAEHRDGSAPAGDMHGTVGKLTVPATVPKAAVAKVLHGHLAALRACYEGELSGKASKGGSVDLALTISDRGAVTLARVKRSTLAGGDPELCIVRTLGTLRLPRPSDGQDASVSFTLDFRGAR
ncbi:MAG TPA: AgmX/PglI C-terminal domain-containing protein [Polyangia bacterium]|jgi:hypothetical protein